MWVPSGCQAAASKTCTHSQYVWDLRGMASAIQPGHPVGDPGQDFPRDGVTPMGEFAHVNKVPALPAEEHGLFTECEPLDLRHIDQSLIHRHPAEHATALAANEDLRPVAVG